LRIALLFILLIFSPVTKASPEKLTFVFLTEEVAKSALDLINYVPFGGLLAEANTPKDCAPMGDGCFHPQYGFIPNTDLEKNESKKPPKEEAPSEASKVRTINSLETNMIECEEGNHFDIFCGKSKKDSRPGDVEIWFDISTSMRKVDWNHKDPMCHRQQFATKLERDCKAGISFSVYNTSIKQISQLSTICTSKGDNDSKRLTQWIDNSQAKHLVVITDIDEMSGQLKDYLDMIGANIVGVGVKPFYSTDLQDWAKKNLRSCYK
jgi:hypothetical protein